MVKKNLVFRTRAALIQTKLPIVTPVVLMIKN